MTQTIWLRLYHPKVSTHGFCSTHVLGNDSAQRRRVYKMHLIRYFPHFVSLFIYFIHKDSFFQVYSDSAPGKKAPHENYFVILFLLVFNVQNQKNLVFKTRNFYISYDIIICFSLYKHLCTYNKPNVNLDIFVAQNLKNSAAFKFLFFSIYQFYYCNVVLLIRKKINYFICLIFKNQQKRCRQHFPVKLQNFISQ